MLRGVRVHYVEAGEGPTLVLLHGLFSDHRIWRRVIPTLAQQYRVVAPDLPGFGASEKPTRYPFTREALASTLYDLLAGVNAPRASIVGEGLGGTVALTLAADHPECVERLVVSGAPAFVYPRSFRARLPTLPVLGAAVFKQFWGRILFHQHFRNEVFAPGYAYDRRLVDSFYENFDPPEARECAYKALKMLDGDPAPLEVKLGKIRCPTAVVWGDRDRIPLGLGQRLASRIRGARLEVLSGAGAAPSIEQPEALAAVIARHLAPTSGAVLALPSPVGDDAADSPPHGPR